ncbi:hypothetical protein GCM10007855_19570 [Aliivibrio sifiae]|uniref:Beta-ketoacyl synthase N-terminal domain-containing protein n=1 Tax=Aliivibrio sifiae TaxID=566293 RepID=A0ABQ6AHI3_9GAMM|nr:hypothetical protein GCM10007855_19570 [Aliivibrio sifiae]
MMYIHCTASVNIRQDQNVDVKAECKKVAPAFVRRTDRFIQLGLLGTASIKEQKTLDKNTALFMISGQGNLSVFNRLCQQRYLEEVPPKPVDFINSLSNTAGFYIAKFLDLESKNLNLAQQGFVIENALLLANANLSSKREDRILLGGVDERVDVNNNPHGYLDLPTETALGEGSNWMLLSANKQDALATVDVLTLAFDSTGVIEYVNNQVEVTHVAFGQRMPNSCSELILSSINIPPFECNEVADFYETNGLFVLNSYIKSKQGCLAYIDYFNDIYRVITLNVV